MPKTKALPATKASPAKRLSRRGPAGWRERLRLVTVKPRAMALPAGIDDGGLVFWTWFHRISFLLTGIFTTIMNQVIFYQGVGDPSTGFISLPTYLGMLSVLILPVSRTPSAIQQWKIAGSASADVCANALCVLGLQVVGSGVYQVLY